MLAFTSYGLATPYVRFLDDVVEVLTAEQVDGPEDLAFFATTPAFDAKLAATTAARIRAVLATKAAPSAAATCAAPMAWVVTIVTVLSGLDYVGAMRSGLREVKT